MWDLKTKTNDQTKQKQTHRHREQTDGRQRGGGWGLGEKGEGIEKYRAVVTEWSRGCKAQHGE